VSVRPAWARGRSSRELCVGLESQHTHHIRELELKAIAPRTSTQLAMPEKSEDRASLVNRQLPEMTLSTAENPLTAPRPPPDSLTPAQRAAYRFQVKGNAIST
jgi:hypothetical protein